MNHNLSEHVLASQPNNKHSRGSSDSLLDDNQHQPKRGFDPVSIARDYAKYNILPQRGSSTRRHNGRLDSGIALDVDRQSMGSGDSQNLLGPFYGAYLNELDPKLHERSPSWPLGTRIQKPRSDRVPTWGAETTTSSEFPKEPKLVYGPFASNLTTPKEPSISGSVDSQQSSASLRSPLVLKRGVANVQTARIARLHLKDNPVLERYLQSPPRVESNSPSDSMSPPSADSSKSPLRILKEESSIPDLYEEMSTDFPFLKGADDSTLNSEHSSTHVRLQPDQSHKDPVSSPGHIYEPLWKFSAAPQSVAIEDDDDGGTTSMGQSNVTAPNDRSSPTPRYKKRASHVNESHAVIYRSRSKSSSSIASSSSPRESAEIVSPPLPPRRRSGSSPITSIISKNVEYGRACKPPPPPPTKPTVEAAKSTPIFQKSPQSFFDQRKALDSEFTVEGTYVVSNPPPAIRGRALSMQDIHSVETHSKSQDDGVFKKPMLPLSRKNGFTKSKHIPVNPPASIFNPLRRQSVQFPVSDSKLKRNSISYSDASGSNSSGSTSNLYKKSTSFKQPFRGLRKSLSQTMVMLKRGSSFLRRKDGSGDKPARDFSFKKPATPSMDPRRFSLPPEAILEHISPPKDENRNVYQPEYSAYPVHTSTQGSIDKTISVHDANSTSGENHDNNMNSQWSCEHTIDRQEYAKLLRIQSKRDPFVAPAKVDVGKSPLAMKRSASFDQDTLKKLKTDHYTERFNPNPYPTPPRRSPQLLHGDYIRHPGGSHPAPPDVKRSESEHAFKHHATAPIDKATAELVQRVLSDEGKRHSAPNGGSSPRPNSRTSDTSYRSGSLSISTESLLGDFELDLLDLLKSNEENLKSEKTAIEEKVAASDKVAEQITKLLESQCDNKSELSKFRSYVEELDKILLLLLKLSSRLAKAENMLVNLDPDCSDQIRTRSQDRRDLLVKQLDDAREIKHGIDRRGRQVQTILRRYFAADQIERYENFIQHKAELIINKQLVDESVSRTVDIEKAVTDKCC